MPPPAAPINRSAAFAALGGKMRKAGKKAKPMKAMPNPMAMKGKALPAKFGKKKKSP